MFFKIGSRRSGKTTELVRLATMHEGSILVTTDKERHYLHREHGFPLEKIVTLDELLTNRYHAVRAKFVGPRPLYIDNLDIILKALVRSNGFNLIGFTMTPE
jgi:hypothetical protein